MPNNVVPFGKYKGQAVEVLAEDREYTDWLMGQSWFKDRYQNIYTLIVNNFGEPSETPEHNELQALFLDDVFAQWVVFVCHRQTVFNAIKPAEERRLQHALAGLNDLGDELVLRTSVWFEVAGADVLIEWQYRYFSDDTGEFGWVGLSGAEFKVEIKPSCG